jgi:hypothetical protein
MRRTGITIALTTTALAGLALAGLSHAAALPAERTITRDFVALEFGSTKVDIAGLGANTDDSIAASTTTLRKDVAATKKALAGRPGVRSVTVDCGDVTTDVAGPSFEPAFSTVYTAPPPYALFPQAPVPKIVLNGGGTWNWDVTAKQTCTFVLRR